MAARAGRTLVMLILAALLLAAPGWETAAQGEAGRSLSLQEAIRLAWDQGPELEAERRALAEAELNARQTGVPYRPQAGLNAGYTLREGQDGAWTVSLSVDQTLALKPLLGGAAPEQMRQAQRALRQAERALDEARQDVARSVMEAYLDLLEARAAVERRAEALEQAEAVLEQTELRAGLEAASEADLLEARADALSARQALAQAELDATRAQTALNRHLGLPLRTELHPAILESPSAQGDLPADGSHRAGEAEGLQDAAIPSLEGLLAHALEHRVDLLQAREAVAEARLALDELKRPYEPSLSLTAGYTGDDGSVGVELPLDSWEMKLSGQARLYRSGTGAGPGEEQPRFKGWSAGLSLGLPFLDGGSRKTTLEQHELDLEALESQLEDLEATVAEEVRQAHEAYLLAQEALPVRQLQLEAARIRLEGERIRFEAGVITPRQLAEAQAAYQSALASATSARFAVLRAAASLQRAAGLPVADQEGLWMGLDSVLPQEEE